jgi:hypothetical protein
MNTPERVVLIVCLIGGFLWLRGRSRRMNLESRQVTVVVGIFLVLPALLLAEKALFEKLPWGPWVNAPIMGISLIATFAGVGFGFLRPSGTDGEPPGHGPAGESPKG